MVPNEQTGNFTASGMDAYCGGPVVADAWEAFVLIYESEREKEIMLHL